ncbi:hypothetical protein F5882DRAFT_414784, partial [Hyaloscypha sp. PMI_1271]
MAKPTKRQVKGGQKIRCERSGCTVTFGRDSDRLRHVREKHGPPLHCRIHGCQWITKRKGKLRNHLDTVHGGGGISKLSSPLSLWFSSITPFTVCTNFTLSCEFRTAPAQSLASSNYFSTPDINLNPNLTHASPLIPIHYTFTPQAAHQFQAAQQFPLPDVSESYTALNSNDAPPSPGEHNSTPDLLTAFRSRAQATSRQPRVFRPCRVRRQKACSTAQRTDSPLAQHVSALDTTLDFYPGVEGQDNWYPIAFAQDEGLPCTPGVEPIAGFLGSLSLDYPT